MYAARRRELQGAVRCHDIDSLLISKDMPWHSVFDPIKNIILDKGGYTLAKQLYHKWYSEEQVANKTTFHGVTVVKSVGDLWNFQEIFFELRPSLIVEFGTLAGGSALFYAHTMESIKDHFRVLSVDISDQRIDPAARKHPKIEILIKSSVDPAVVNRIRELRTEFEGPMFISLDSAHTKDHVLQEMKSIRPILRPGDYVVVEDGHCGVFPLAYKCYINKGPLAAIQEYESEFPDDFLHDEKREHKFGFTFHPSGFLIKR